MQPTNDYYGGGFQPQMGTNRPSSRRKLLLIVGAVLLLITVALGVLSSIGGLSGSDAKGSTVSAKMIKLIGEGNGVDSYKLLSSEATQITTSTDWIKFVVQNKVYLSKSTDDLKPVYVEKLNDTSQEEGYNIGEKGSIYRVKLIVNTKDKLIEAITVTRTSL